MIRPYHAFALYRLFLVLLVSASAASAPAQEDDRPVLLVLGDSLSAGYGIDPREGWVALLQARLDASGHRLHVVNASISGDTTRGGLARLPAAFARHPARIVVIELGANDGLRGLPISEIEHNLEALVRTARAQGARVLLIGIRLPLNYGQGFREAFEAVYTRVAQAHDVPLVHSLLAPIERRPELFQGDGVHPGAAAQPLILDHVWQTLRPILDRPYGRSPAPFTAPRPSP